MDLVSKMLENIMVVQSPTSDHTSNHDALATDIGAKRTSVSSTEQLESAPPAQMVQSSQYSSFWYLDDDPLKAPNQLSEKLMERVMSLIVGPETEGSLGLEGRMDIHKTRPPFSVNLMATNSTQLGQKSGPIFEMIDTVLMIVGWYNPFFTVGSGMLMTHVILNPYLASAIPTALLLKKFLIPSYLKLYPPDSSLVDGLNILHNPIPYDGPPLDKYEPPKVCSQYSRQFLMNFADLQNFQVGYIHLYDALVDWGQHYFLFEDQKLTTAVYLALLAMSAGNLISLPYIVPLIVRYFPVKLCFVIMLWLAIALCHPKIVDRILDHVQSEDARLARLDRVVKFENQLMKVLANDDDLEDELREVEIFELHRLDKNNMWKPVGFSTTFYALSHPSRVLSIGEDELKDDDPKEHEKTFLDEENEDEDYDVNEVSVSHIEELDPDAHFSRKATLADIKPPRNWVFTNSPWAIDLEPTEWVKDNCIMDLVSVDDEEKWVYDFVDGTESPDGNIYRRRRWVRNCKRENIAAKRKQETRASSISGSQSTEWLSKTLNNLSLTTS
ncbi:CIC11C00000003872 [Sungouiella intermedia]|uniref:CIC11C00000003872 n=1 Tax=Sungouiella intermedia TaxID=45354 RepID=A0A1L0BYH3_9ASCO|nr:CIC11C00000003872 [[Candida] intermedia]